MVLMVLVLLLVVNTASSQYPQVSCDDTSISYELNSSFHNNLKSLLDSLSILTIQNEGFYNTSSGNGSDQVHGRALCRGDIASSICKNCLADAREEILSRCRKQVGAIWCEKCQMDYSYRVLPSGYAGQYPDTDSTKASDPGGFCNALSSLKDTLSKSVASSRLMFATGNLRFSEGEILYGLMQCTRDTDSGKCRSCLNSAFGDLNGCNSAKGGVVLSRTCNLRFELYQFYDKPHTKGKLKEFVVIAICAAILFVALVGFYVLCRKRRTKARDEENSQCRVLQEEVLPMTDHLMIRDETSFQDLPFMEFSIIKEATHNFSDSFKLGHGGFGTVYKGILSDGKEIAVKRLSRRSWQGPKEFMNEIKIIAKLQHKNLVRLLSCSLKGNEKLLIYEYVPNKSLDIFLFDIKKRMLLDWKKRINIINGIARGLLYLHEESRLKIVHRDLKPSNVLLDQEMSAKISDFGLARIFCDNQNEGKTNRVAGTHGYMAPEYAMEGLYSTKSDVFSFGVILLEIISGNRNSGFHLTQHAQTLLAYAWMLWNKGQELDLVDPILTESCEMEELGRYVNLGLLCVQEDPAERPTMSEVGVLLESKLTPPPYPNKPRTFSAIGRVVRCTDIITDKESSSAVEHSVNQVTVSSMAPR